jgi:hypothetical protein
MAAFEELMTAIGQVLREQLPVRRRNDRIIPAGKNKHRRLDAWLERFQAGKVARVGSDIFRGLRKPSAGGGQPVVLENRGGRRHGRGLGDELHRDLAALHTIESAWGRP